VASSPEEMHTRSILAAQAQPGMHLAKGGTKAIKNSWLFCHFTSNLCQILNSLFSENKQDFIFAWLESNPKVSWNAFERDDPVVQLDWRVPGALAQHTLLCPWEPGCVCQPGAQQSQMY